MRTIFIFILIISFFNLSAQEIVKGLAYNTIISSSGVAMGGTTTSTTIVISSMCKNAQITGLVPDTSQFYEKLNLNEFDTLTIMFRSYRPHMGISNEALLRDSLLPEPKYTEDGNQKTISFSYHPHDYNAFPEGDSLKLEYIWQGNNYIVNLPKHNIKEWMRP
ncbi:MAG: hypothetical protein ABIJ97_13870 [Bacteroidota bacterium]